MGGRAAGRPGARASASPPGPAPAPAARSPLRAPTTPPTRPPPTPARRTQTRRARPPARGRTPPPRASAPRRAGTGRQTPRRGSPPRPPRRRPASQCCADRRTPPRSRPPAGRAASSAAPANAATGFAQHSWIRPLLVIVTCSRARHVTPEGVMTQGDSSGTLAADDQAGAWAEPLVIPPRVGGQGPGGGDGAHHAAGPAGHGLRRTGGPAADHGPVHVHHVPARLRGVRPVADPGAGPGLLARPDDRRHDLAADRRQGRREAGNRAGIDAGD